MGYFVIGMIVLGIFALMFWLNRRTWFSDTFRQRQKSAEEKKPVTEKEVGPESKAKSDVKKLEVRTNNKKWGNIFTIALKTLVVVVAGLLIWNWRELLPTREKVATTTQVTTRTFTVIAPIAPEWSEVVLAPGLLNFYPERGSICVILSNSNEPICGITRDSGKKLGGSKTIKFQSEGLEGVDVTYFK